MTLTLKSGMMVLLAGLAAAVLLMTAPQAYAQSEVTGTLSSGTAATGSVATGTITGGGGNTISGTVVDDDNGGGGGGGGGSRRSSSSNNNNDGEVLGTEVGPTDGVGGGGDVFTPGVPSTGAGDPLPYIALLLGSLGVFGAGLLSLRYRL